MFQQLCTQVSRMRCAPGALGVLGVLKWSSRLRSQGLRSLAPEGPLPEARMPESRASLRVALLAHSGVCCPTLYTREGPNNSTLEANMRVMHNSPQEPD